jgi:predicted phosphodiesterase
MFSEFNLFEVEGAKVLMTHIGGYPRHYTPKALQHIHVAQPKIFVAGHSHILKVIYDPVYNLLHINPGACGRQGFHLKSTLVKFCLDNGKAKDLDIMEFEKNNIK